MADETRKSIIVSVEADTSQASQNLEQLKEKLNQINNINVGGDSVSTLKTQLKLAAEEANKMREAFGENSKEFETASQYLLKLKDNAIDSIGTIKTQLKEANQQAQLMANLYGESSEEFKRAAKEVANLKDRFGEYTKKVEAFNPDNKLQALVSIAKGATGAIQGVTGAMAFLGVESEDANETMAKLQGLMNFSQALDSVDDIKNGFSNFASVLGLTKSKAQESTGAINAQSTATKGAALATKAFGTAFKAIGIGLIISAIAYLVENWDKVRAAVVKLIPALGNISGIFNQVKQVAFGLGNTIIKFVIAPMKALFKAVTGDFSGAMDELKAGVDVSANYMAGKNKEIANQAQSAADDRLKKSIANREKELEVIKASGRDTYNAERKIIQDKLSLQTKGSEEYNELLQSERVLTASHNKKVADESKAAADKRAAANKEAQSKIDAANKEAEAKYNEHVKTVEKINEDSIKIIAQSKLDDRSKELDNIKNEFAEKEKLIKSQYSKSAALEKTALENLAKEKSIKELEVQDKYNKIISDFINGYQESAYQKSRSKLIEDFDEKIKIADEKQKIILQKLKDSEVAELDKKEELRIDVVNKETNLVKTQTSNEILDSDTAETRVAKLQSVYDAETAFKKAKFDEEFAKLDGDLAAQNNLKAKYDADATNSAAGFAESRMQIAEQEKQAKLAMFDLISGASDAAAELIGKNTVAGKALSIATTTIDTYLAAQKAYSSQMSVPSPDAPIRAALAAGTAVLQGLARVKAIVAVKVPAKGGAGAGAAGAGSSMPTLTAPTLNVTQLSQDLTREKDVRVINQQDQIIKSYIVDRELQENEDKREFLKKLQSL